MPCRLFIGNSHITGRCFSNGFGWWPAMPNDGSRGDLTLMKSVQPIQVVKLPSVLLFVLFQVWVVTQAWGTVSECAIPHVEPAPVVSLAPVANSPYFLAEFRARDAWRRARCLEPPAALRLCGGTPCRLGYRHRVQPGQLPQFRSLHLGSRSRGGA